MDHEAAALIQASVQLASAVLYLWVARIVLHRPVEREARRANVLFALWWIALGVVFVLGPIFSVSTRVFGFQNLPLAITVLNVFMLLIVAAVWGLVYYLVYLYTGSERAFWPITAFYAVMAAVLLFLVAWVGPNGFDETGALTYTRRQLSGAPSIAFGLAFSLPVVAAALAYGSLFFRVEGAMPRYRIAMVAGAFLIQFGWSMVSTILQLSRRFPNSLTLSLIGNAIGVFAAVMILLAFRPPRAILARLTRLPGGV